MFQPFKLAAAAPPTPPRDVRPKIGAPLYFLEARLANVRGFHEARGIDLSDGSGSPCQWNVVLGGHNSGKTTLLQCLAAVFPKFADLDDQAVRATARVYGDPRLADHFSTAMQMDTHTEVLASLATGRTSAGVEIAEAPLELYFDIGSNGDLSSKHVEVAGRGAPCCAYGASRHLSRPTAGASHKSDCLYGLFDDLVPLPNPEESIGELLFLASNSSRHQLAARAVRTALLSMLVDLFPDIHEVRIREPEQLGDMPMVHCRLESGWMPIGQLSAGYRTTMAWVVNFVVHLLEHYPRSSNPLAEPAVCLVDEIELHLHPSWQLQIMGLLTTCFPATQFIVTTSSPFIVKGSDGGNLILLRQHGDRMRVVQCACDVADMSIGELIENEELGFLSPPADTRSPIAAGAPVATATVPALGA